MVRHEHFDIWLHGDAELSRIQGSGVKKREELCSWPLSVVERVVFENGVSRIYKAFRNLPVETEFYRRASSRNIPAVFFNETEGERHWLLLEDVRGLMPENTGRESMLALAWRAREVIGAVNYNCGDDYHDGKQNNPFDVLLLKLELLTLWLMRRV